MSERLEEMKEWFYDDEELHQFQIEWLFKQAERAKIYQKALMEIGAKHEPPSSKIANDALWIADYRRHG